MASTLTGPCILEKAIPIICRDTESGQEIAIIDTHDIRGELGHYLTRLWRYGMVLSRKPDIADDLVQSTCVRALERAGQFTVGTALDRWLFSILHSIWINEIRSRQIRQGQGFVDIDEAMAENDQGDSESTVWANQIMARVNQLPEAQRNAVFLVYVEGFTYQEAAQTLSVPIGTIMSRLAAARLTLAKYADISSANPQVEGDRI
ncbi:sigma-70 family RNA polymerase sigma factor [Sodalis sp. dw_96]|uniref:sigma-70 family RNA polymerase sigma factor n=1 Tax=Sodalis sp. dw_96 TaxID=2719794 RepID=UPI001BD259E7|nr:sigma-70 family RNA polymerase sigma factor [Sodalis sp. dw_96]